MFDPQTLKSVMLSVRVGEIYYCVLGECLAGVVGVGAVGVESGGGLAGADGSAIPRGRMGGGGRMHACMSPGGHGRIMLPGTRNARELPRCTTES